jgi:hypothetical protein
MKKILLFSLLLLAAVLPIMVEAQEVPKRIIVEHFTNTRCGICSSRNPGFYSNLNNQEGILHISFHPSSPYSNCLLHQANPGENDARTNFYNIYGGTPRLVIQGEVLSSGANYASATIFDNYLNQTTPISLTTYQTKEDGQINITLVITAEADNTIGNASLLLAAAEDVVFYDAPNGENEHYDVFRKTFTGNATDYSVTVPATAGETNILNFSLTPESDWDFARLFAIAILQHSDDKSVIQSTASNPGDNEPLVGTTQPNTLLTSIFPNPVNSLLQVKLAEAVPAKAQLFNTQGSLLQQQSFNGQTTFDLSDYPSGIYWLEVSTETEKAIRRIVKA